MFQTGKIKVSRKKEYIMVKIKPGKQEEINKRELQIFQQKILQGIMQPRVSEKDVLVYVAPNGIPLKKYLKSGLSKQEFFEVFVQLLEVTQKIESNGMHVNNLLLQLEYTFINENTKEVQMVYQPVYTKNVASKVFPFLYNVIHSTVFLINEDVQRVNELMGYMKRMQQYSAEKIEDYIEEIYPEAFKNIERTKSKAINRQQVAVKTYILRMRTRERIDIRKAEFWIGKEPAKTDYCIANNPSISRRHAVIRRKNNSFFIQDNRSTNKTFVNGRELHAGQEIQLRNGDMIMLANERFVFYAE
ncbi:MAG: FHA domain-containing protein [Lachnospiraceae bacterium]|nr:FHA domain-containing protein [Lachnospiraceae bacterium]